MPQTRQELARGAWFESLAALLATDPQAPAEATALAQTGARILALDAEDFAAIAAGSRAPWADDLARCGFPATARAQDRGALDSLVPLYGLLLELLEVRAARDEPLWLVVLAHLIGEYLRQLAWEPRLGHAGDPARLVRTVGERWGSDDPSCAHPPALRTVARRSVQAAAGDDVAWQAYLDKVHSRQGEALAVCAMNHKTTKKGARPTTGLTCAKPCGWVLQGSDADRAALDARCRLAGLYVDSPLVALRHHAPVGHFFAVPSRTQIDEAWAATWALLVAPWADGGNPLQGQPSTPPATDEVLGGMSLLLATVAGRPVPRGHLVADLATALTAALGD